MKSQNTRKLQILISGRVHGVGFRRFVQKAANELKIRGWARNLMDGRVQVIAEGQEAELNEFCERLRKGPLFAQVEDVKVGDCSEKLTSDQFLILPDGETV